MGTAQALVPWREGKRNFCWITRLAFDSSWYHHATSERCSARHRSENLATESHHGAFRRVLGRTFGGIRLVHVARYEKDMNTLLRGGTPMDGCRHQPDGYAPMGQHGDRGREPGASDDGV